MRLYLDICCFNRPFDDQSQLLVRLQTEAKLSVQTSIRSGEHSLVWSAILDLENLGNPDRERCLAIDAWKILAEVDVATTPAVERLAVELESVGLKPLDALHMASAITANAHVFLTTDKGILRKMKAESRIAVLDPLDFINQQDDENDEN
jgi:hypothetical protein